MHVLRRVIRPRAMALLLFTYCSTLPAWCAAVSRVTNDAFEIGGVSPLPLGGIYAL